MNEFYYGIREVNLNILKLNLGKRMGFVLIDLKNDVFVFYLCFA